MSAGLHGMLIIDKPKGLVSKDVSRILQRQVLPPQVRLGHVGSLDPLAEGVLPILLGAATRLQQHVLASLKVYDVTLVFGVQTDTMDITGQPIRVAALETSVTRERAQQALAALVGELELVPPLYSAIKFKGQPLYKYARAGRAHEIDLASLARTVQITSITLQELSWVQRTHQELAHLQEVELPLQLQTLAFRVACSKGTYVRSLCDLIGRRLGGAATMRSLRRVQTGGVHIGQAIPLAQLTTSPQLVDAAIIPLAQMPLRLPRLAISAQLATRFSQGQRLAFTIDLHEHNPAAGDMPQLTIPPQFGLQAPGGRCADEHKAGQVEGAAWVHPWWPVLRLALGGEPLGENKPPQDCECMVQHNDGTVLGLGSLRFQRYHRSVPRSASAPDVLSAAAQHSLIHVVLKQKRGLRQ